MPESSQPTAREHNTQVLQQAHTKLDDFCARALAMKAGQAKNVILRIPLHGQRLGKPLASIEQE